MRLRSISETIYLYKAVVESQKFGAGIYSYPKGAMAWPQGCTMRVRRLFFPPMSMEYFATGSPRAVQVGCKYQKCSPVYHIPADAAVVGDVVYRAEGEGVEGVSLEALAY